MDTPTATLNVLRTEPKPCSIKLDIEMPADMVKSMLDDMVAWFRKSARVPGFRAGKTPRSLILKRFRKEILEEAKGRLIEQGVRQACEQEELTPETSPRVENEDAVTVTDGEDFVFAATFDVAPEFELPEYKGIPVDRELEDVDDQSVQDVIDGFLKQRASYERVERPAEEGDLLKVTYHGKIADAEGDDAPPESAKFFLDAEETWLALREPEIIPGAKDALIGVEEKQTRDVQVHFPEGFAESALAGKTVDYRFEVIEVQAAQVPEFTDDVAKEIGAESADEVRDRVRQNLEADRARKQEDSVRSQVVNAILEKVDTPLPPSVLARETYQMYSRILEQAARQGQTEDQLRNQQSEIGEQARTQAQQRLLRYYVLRKIADAEKIEVTPEEVNEAIESLSQYHRVAPKVLQRRLRDSGRLADIVIGLRESKAVERLVALSDGGQATDDTKTEGENESAEE